MKAVMTDASASSPLSYGPPSRRTLRVAGYGLTSNVVIEALTTHCDAVTVRALAYETTGAAQTCTLKHLVRSGIIIAGSSNLVRTSG